MELANYKPEERALQRYIVFGKCSHEFVKIHSTRVKNSFRATGYEKSKNALPFLFNYEPLIRTTLSLPK